MVTNTRFRHRAFSAFRGSGIADFSAKPHDSVAKRRGFLRGCDFHQDFLNFVGCFLGFGVKSKATANADAMGVGDNGGLVEYVSQEQIGNFSPDPGKF